MAKKMKGDRENENGFEEWGGYMNAKMSKLEGQFLHEAQTECPNASNLFEGIAIFVNGYTEPPADELRRLMMQNGGIYHHYMRPQSTTHIIASNLPYSKIVLYRKAKDPHPICKPEWITDSLKANKVLNYQDYLLYTHHTGAQQQLNFKRVDDLNTVESNLNAVKESRIIQNCGQDSQQTYVENITSKDNPDTTKPANVKEQPRCSKDSGFLSEFYSNSRLHHISTMGATFKDYVNQLREKNKGDFPGLEKLKEQKEHKSSPTLFDSDNEDESFNLDFEVGKNVKFCQQPIIMHIDMDCFFVSVGLRNKPELKGLPVAVTHAKGNRRPQKNDHNLTDSEEETENLGSLSEIASCSYEARKMGLKNGMFLGQALKLCPNLKTIKYDFEGYKEVSYILYNTVASYTLDIEAVSCDEMYADCTKLLELTGLTPLEFATVIRQEIKTKTGCPVSTGFGNNKLQARLATKRAKPDGQFYLRNEQVESYIGTFKVTDLPGVGYTTARKLNAINVNTCAELQRIPSATLQKELGNKLGETVYNMCRGIDHSKLNVEHVRKSVSAEVNYGIRFQNNGDAVDFLKKLSEEVCNRLKNANAKGRCVTLKLMVRAKEAPVETLKFMGHGPCDFITRSKNVNIPVDNLTIITKEVISIWNQLHQVPEDIRGIGIQISRLEILKHKSNRLVMMNFVNKTKETEMKYAATENWRANVNVPNRHVSKKTSSTKTLKGFFPAKESIPMNNVTRPAVNKIPDIVHSLPGNVNADNNCPEQSIDASFLNNLPEDIQNEIVSHKGYKIKSKTDNPQTDVIPPERSSINNKSKQLSVTNVTTSKNEPLKDCSNSPRNSQPNILVPSQDIDESILDELPEDIRNEVLRIKHKRINSSKTQKVLNQPNTYIEPILGPSISHQEVPLVQHTVSTKANLAEEVFVPTEREEENNVASETLDQCRVERHIKAKNKNQATLIQTSQEKYFKHKKPSSNKPAKVEMPPMQEIDMSVLIELPEDIRNEILNEYKMNKDRNTVRNTTPPRQISHDSTDNAKLPPKQTNIDEQSLSFSQVDPEFLAALSEDMRRDVKSYCMANKKDNLLQNKQYVNAIPVLNPVKTTKSPSKKRNCLKQEKKSDKRSKNAGMGAKIANQKSKNSRIITLTQHANKSREKVERKKERVEPTESYLSQTKLCPNNVPADQAEAIISHNRTLVDDSDGTDEHQEMLIALVNHLFNLPLNQVKMQIQTWVTKSKIVNEVDFLSLATFLSMLPGKKRIEDLHTLMKTMHRCMTKSGSCIWHRTYRKTVKHVQQYMQIEYNSNLMVPPIRCNLLECNSDDVI